MILLRGGLTPTRLTPASTLEGYVDGRVGRGSWRQMGDVFVVIRLPRLLLLLTPSAAASFYLPLVPTESISTNLAWNFVPPSRICWVPKHGSVLKGL